MEQSIQLIPVNGESRDKAGAVLKRHHFGAYSAENFIAMYNSGIFTYTNPIIKNIALAIEENFVNVTISRGNKIIVKSAEEVACENAMTLLKDWKVAVKLKRFASILLDDSYDPDTRITFSEDKPGIPQCEIWNAETNRSELVPHWASEKLIGKNADLANNVLISPLARDYEENEEKLGDVYFRIEDLIDIKDEFILEIERIILSSTLRDSKGEQ